MPNGEQVKSKGWLSVVEAVHAIGIAPERLRQALRDGEVEREVRRCGSDHDSCFIGREVVEAPGQHLSAEEIRVTCTLHRINELARSVASILDTKLNAIGVTLAA